MVFLMNRIDLFSPFSLATSCTLQIGLQITIYHKAPLRSTVFAVLFMLLIVMIDSITVNIVSYTVHISTAEIYEEFSPNRVLALISSKTMLFVLVYVIHYFLASAKTLNRKYMIGLTLVTIAMLLATSLLTFLDIRNETTSSLTGILFFLAMLILLLTVFLGSFKWMAYYETQQNMNLISLKNQMLECSMKETEQTFQLWKTSLHDYKHRIADLKVMADKGDLTGIQEFLEKENALLSQKLFYYKTGNSTVDTILSMKQHIAESKGIAFLIHAAVPQDCKVTSAHFASMLGNLLDNAIEASSREQNPYIEVKIGQVKEQLVITITNKCTTPVSFQTTKQNKLLHGIGLHSVRQTVRSYQGEFIAEQDGDLFQAKIMIPITE